ncbi:MAG: YdcH family protein [Sulfurimonas sp.]
MLHEYRDEIHALKQKNAHFAKIFDEHNELDQMTTDADEGRLHLTDTELEAMKKKKLHLKDEALTMILKHKQENV